MTDLRIPSGATIVADTNSVISYALNRWSVAGVAFHDILNAQNLALSEAIIAEFRTVLLRDKFDRYVARDLRERFLAEFSGKATVSPPATVSIGTDPDNRKFLELALASGADAIVSGDHDLPDLAEFQGIPILTPRRYLAARGVDG